MFFFLYMFPFLYTTDATNITNGVSHLPHHVWTDAQPLRDGANVEPDVIMRSIWVHGGYMKALEPDVLQGALELQDEILGPTTNFRPRENFHGWPTDLEPNVDLDREQRDAFHITNGLTSQSWFFHSALQYWDGSAAKIAADPSLVATVNQRKAQSTLVNTTLRHSIVFSGKRFEERRLVAADAVVITLLHLADSPVGRQWTRKVEAQARSTRPDDKWDTIPPGGQSASNQLYLFRFQPMSSYDWVMLTLAYSLTLSHLALRLSKLRAIKSRVGLTVTILAQIVGSILSSFTVCAILEIDLSRVPHYAYPLVVLAISLENSFRLINAVIITSSTINLGDRIGDAFGATAHIAIANRVQNILVLYGLSKVTADGVSAFCTFAAIATFFDFFYLSTFFLTVISVDVRQRELIELEKASLQKKKKHTYGDPPKQPWLNRMYPIRWGDTTMSTRIASTIVAVGFVFIAQAHYTPEGSRPWLNQLLALSWRAGTHAPGSSLLVDIHQARSPPSWLRLQDHETAREVIKVIKPATAHSYVARVYDPVVFVMKGANRNPDTKEPLFLPAIYDFIHHQIPLFTVSLITVLSALRLFTHFLIKGRFGGDEDPNHPDDEPLLSVRSLVKGHTLDVAMLTASPNGHLISAGLDRNIQIWDVPSGSRTRVLSDADIPLANPFPVLSMALDDSSRWLALISWQKVFVWDIEIQQWVGSQNVELGGHRPETAFFTARNQGSTPSLVLVKRSGLAVEIQLGGMAARDFVICKTPLVWAVSFAEKYNPQQQHTAPVSILTASRRGCIHIVRYQGGEWISSEMKLQGESWAKDVHSLVPIPTLSQFLIGRSQSVDLVDLASSTVIHTFQTETMQPRSLKQVSLNRGHQSGSPALTLCYNSAEDGDLIVHTCLTEDAKNNTSPNTPTENPSAQTWQETTRRIPNPGVWEALPLGSIVGVHKKRNPRTPRASTPSPAGGLRKRSPSSLASAPANGGPANQPLPTPSWEAWVFNLRPNTKFEFESRSLDNDDRDTTGLHSHLMISELGPMTRLGATSVAVGLGEVVKVVSVGHEYFDGGGSDALASEGLQVPLQRVVGVGARRKKGSGGSAGLIASRSPVLGIRGSGSSGSSSVISSGSGERKESSPALRLSGNGM
ncbi:sterol-sensing domain of SREBP cleavage-activation-domain-containing protein [Chaetomium sp. MPI-SDFR-AT-0129]|nr:sterol-sensing domain of SREBP cleavage-activation-domain-containing protein [Chaetomium sp. MPI-SDFR-AT-0129]